MLKHNTVKLMFVLGLLAVSVMASQPSAAWWRGGGWRGGGCWRCGYGGGWYGGGLGVGLVTGAVIGSELANPYPYYYPGYPQTVVIQQPTVTEVQQQPVAPPVSAPPANLWYYCDSARAYYPYVSNCPQPWRAVPAMPPPGQ